MSKYKCALACIYGCTVETIGTKPAPDYCLYTGDKRKWVPDYPEQFGNSEQLPEQPNPATDGKLHVRFKKLRPDAKAPYQATPGSAGFDLTAVSRSRINRRGEIDDRGCRLLYGTGLAVEIPAGHVGLLFPRSSIYKEQMTLTNCVGVIDSDYRGEIKAVFSGKGMGGYKTGDRIAQLVIIPIPAVKFEEADELTETERGAGGYGSTGR